MSHDVFFRDEVSPGFGLEKRVSFAIGLIKIKSFRSIEVTQRPAA